MKWVRTLILFDKGDVIASDDWATLHTSYTNAIASIDHPQGSGSLRLRVASRNFVTGCLMKDVTARISTNVTGHFGGT